jgi:hypothetical protein
MNEANAKQMVESIENALKKSGNSNLTAFNLPNKADAIQALMVGSCTAFSEEMAKGFTATITANEYNSSVLNTFQETERSVFAKIITSIQFLPKALPSLAMDDNFGFSKYYSTYSGFGKNRYYYALPNSTTSMQVRVTPLKTKNQEVDLTPSNGISIANRNNEADNIAFDLQTTTAAGNYTIVGKQNGTSNTLNTLNVIVCKPKTIPINIYLVHDVGAIPLKVDRNGIKTYLEKFYGAINIKLTINFIDKEMAYSNFDTNKDGKIEESTEGLAMVNTDIDMGFEGFRVMVINYSMFDGASELGGLRLSNFSAHKTLLILCSNGKDNYQKKT